MAQIYEQHGKKYWKNSDGELIPAARIFPHEKRADRMVNKVMKKVQRLQKLITEEKKKISMIVEDHLKAVAKENGADSIDGNITIFDFAKQNQIEQRLSKHFVTDERLNIAKKKIDDLIMKWSDGADDKIIALVNKAFKTDKQGNLNVKQILGLREINIKDKEWKEAMKLITDCISVDYTKTYLNFRTRDESGKLVSLPLNFSAM